MIFKEVKEKILHIFINREIFNESFNELREVYGNAEGYGSFEVISIVPLVRIYSYVHLNYEDGYHY